MRNVTVIVMLTLCGLSAMAQEYGQFLSNQGVGADLLRHADMHMRRGNFPEALELYNQAIAHDNANAIVYAKRARLYSITGRMNEAASDIRKATELNPYAPYLLDEQSRIKMLMADPIGASADLTDALKKFPHDSLLLTDRLLALMESGQLDSALAVTAELRGRYPLNYVIPVNRSAIYMMMGRYDRTEVELKEAMALNPHCGIVTDLMGQLQLGLGDAQAAIRLHDEAIRLNPELGMAHVNKAKALKALGDTVGALRSLNRGIAIEMDLAHAFVNRALAKRAMGDADGARNDMLRALELDPENSKAIYNLGLLKKQTGDRVGALEAAEALVRLTPDDPDALNLRGSVYAVFNDYDRAISDFDRAILLDPDHHNAFHNRGSVRIFRNQQALACEDFRQSAILGNEEARRKHEAFCSLRW
jgi:tetratricopeptide (TPR) repeat protein